MKIISISDLHGNLPSDLPEGDLLCICGDIVPLHIQRNMEWSKDWFVNTFCVWLRDLKYNHIVFIAGNHDFFFEQTPDLQTYIPQDLQDKVTYLCDSGFEYNGFKIWGSPWVEHLEGWAFNTTKASSVFNKIPKGIDILVTHTPPTLGMVDCVYKELHWGSPALTKALQKKSPKVLLCGHIHEGSHYPLYFENTVIYNCSLLDEYYCVYWQPQVIILNEEK